MCTLTLFCGPPGAGKTTLARRLEADGVGLRLCTDDWQDELGIPMTDYAAHERLQLRLYGLGLDLLSRGVDVVLEDGLWRREERTRVFADARARGARISWHVFEVPAEELRRRLAVRRQLAEPGTAPVTDAELTAILAAFEPPTAEELAAVDEVTVHRPAENLAPADNRFGRPSV
ncbi:AAA family ATPase [Microlunatus sp. GCM10028923]|uniref:AAA family ATPase n=1 Tax=Microlunatus sp. GCM10028923 TaxID=3273400 RepID=UPI00360BE572